MKCGREGVGSLHLTQNQICRVGDGTKIQRGVQLRSDRTPRNTFADPSRVGEFVVWSVSYPGLTPGAIKLRPFGALNGRAARGDI